MSLFAFGQTVISSRLAKHAARWKSEEGGDNGLSVISTTATEYSR